jgi:hypothetical protein
MSKGLYSLVLPLLCIGCSSDKASSLEPDSNSPTDFSHHQSEDALDGIANSQASGINEGSSPPDDTQIPVNEAQPPSVTTLNDLSGGFKVEADLRLKYEAERASERRGRIIGPGTPFDNKAFKNEVNLYVYYEGRNTIGSVRVKFNNKMGSLGGTTDKIAVPKAYFANRLFRAGPTAMRLGLGRRPMDELMESSVQFSSRIDGAYLGLTTTIPKLCDFAIDVIATVVDADYNQYAWGTEAEFNNIRSYGIYFKYALMDWRKKGTSAIRNGSGSRASLPDGRFELRNNPQYQYLTSQFLMGYILDPTYFNIPFRAFGAFLINHAAKPQPFLNGKRENIGWYVGFQVGRGKKPGGISVDFSYQFVEAQAVQQDDVSGIGTSNPRKNSIYGPIYDDITGGALAGPTSSTVNGNTNFQGWQLKTLYRITSHISWRLTYRSSNPAKKALGPDKKLRKFESQWIYNF